jgi:predicted dehydrogenase
MLALSGGGYHNKAGYDTYIGLNGRLGRIHCTSTATPNQIYVESTHPTWAGAPQRTFHYTYAESPAYGGVYGEQFMRAFIQAAQGQGELPTTGEDALQVARVVDAAYESSRTGRRVDLDLWRISQSP